MESEYVPLLFLISDCNVQFLKHHMPFRILEMDYVQKQSQPKCNMSSESFAVSQNWFLLSVWVWTDTADKHTDVYNEGNRYFLYVCDHTYKLSITSGRSKYK